jgi:hypothetical protein
MDMEGADTLLPPLMPAEQPNSSDLCEDGSRIDLLVAYTPAARSQVGGTAAIRALINQRVAEMNTANADSGLSFSYRLVHVMETAYAETGDVEKDLDRLVDNTDPYLSDVIAARDQHLADMTALIIGQATAGYACGIAYLMTDLSTNFADYALNVTALDYADPYSCHPVTLAHEFGHSMGNQHDRANAGGSSIFPYSYGYQSPNETFRTIMAYDCAGDSCPVANLWSNPDVSYAGEPVGVDYEANPSSSADNVRSMAQTAYYVANFRQNCEPGPTPTATSTPTATNTPLTNTPTATSAAAATYTPDAPPGSTATATPTATRTRPLQPWLFLPLISNQ